MKKTVAVIFGGRSVEHEVSIVSANSVMKWLTQAGFEVVPVYINKAGKWIIDEGAKSLDFFAKKINLESSLSLPKSIDNKLVAREGIFGGKSFHIDVIFPVMHGTNGEDGTIQAFADLLNIPYVGCDRKASTLAMDKVLTNLMTEKVGIPHVKWTSFSTPLFEKNKEEVFKKIAKDLFGKEKLEDKLPFPVIVKPTNLGSSVGVSKAKTKKELDQAIEVISYLDSACIVEKCVENLMEVNCAIIGNDEPIASLLECPKKSGDLLDFNDKYLAGSMKGNKKMTEIPAPLDEKTTKAMQEMALNVYKTVGCTGISRVDMLYDMDDKKYYFNEINPMPGSLQAHLWRASGITSPDLVTKLVAYAEERYETNKRFDTNFESNLIEATLLGIAGGKKI